ncbi:MAG: CHASE domain-containing protein [Woeseia sp.]
MSTNSMDANFADVEAERDRLAGAARLHWFHWLIVVLSGVLTLAAWYFAKNQVNEKNELRFEREATQVVELVKERMQKYEDALWSGVAAIHVAGGDISYDQWRSFADSLHIEKKYAGINGIGVIKQVPREFVLSHIARQRSVRPGYSVHPDHSAPELLPIVFIEPEAPNAQAVGLDIAHEANRYAAAQRSRDTGTAQITGPIVLVQDSGSTPGFLFYAPFYQSTELATVSERRESFVGMVYAPFVVKKLMEGTLDKDKRHVGITLADQGQVIYDENQSVDSDFDISPLFRQSINLELYGRTWTFDIQSTRAFRTAASSNQPTFILLGGLLIDSMLLTLFFMLSRASRHTLNFADRMTLALRHKADALAESNADLERFAYVASHDLKTPLRGIADLTTYLEEDLETYLASADANPDVAKNFGRLRQQTRRMESLIKGILEYSSVGGRAEAVAPVDVNAVLETQRLELGVGEHQLVADGELPTLDSYPVRFGQVMSNLIGNAFKYHHDPTRAVVKVRCVTRAECYEFSVSDNGPGIDPKFHARIFEVFQSLQSKDKIEGTGIGLAIVKKSVESLGGSIRVASTPGAGTTFSFTWPRTVAGTPAVRMAAAR